jgi:hypothetical protein
MIFFTMEILMFIMVVSIPWFLFRIPPGLVSFPNKDYWLKEENKPKTKAKLAALMWELGSVLFAFLFLVGLLVLDANLTQPVRLNERLFLLVFIAFMLYTLYWCVKVFRSFRVPKSSGSANPS